MIFEDLIKTALQMNASDIHFQEGDALYVRRNGDLDKQKYVCDMSDMEDFLQQYNVVDGKYRRDFSFTMHGRRFRGNLYKARGKRALALRALAEKIPTFEDLHLPVEMEKLQYVENGLILVVGETGSGKSTSIAATIQKFNEMNPYNIITIEDPVEYVYTPAKSRISQREVGTDVESFGEAVKDAMREDPDIVVLGEMRDRETIQNAITLAETGHLVFGTLHARNVVETVDRIVDVFPGDEKSQMRTQTANVLQAVISQTLVRSEQYGRLPLLEIMRVSQAMRSSLADPKVKVETIRQNIRQGREEGNLHRVDCMQYLIENFDVDVDVAKLVLSEDDYKLLTGNY